MWWTTSDEGIQRRAAPAVSGYPRQAWGLTHEEPRSVSEFAILAFGPPTHPVESTLPLGSVPLSIEPRVVCLTVVTVAGIGIVNYALVNAYGGRGTAIIGFFGGLASSTAVMGAVLEHILGRPEAATYGSLRSCSRTPRWPP